MFRFPSPSGSTRKVGSVGRIKKEKSKNNFKAIQFLQIENFFIFTEISKNMALNGTLKKWVGRAMGNESIYWDSLSKMAYLQRSGFTFF